jgi:hypothetical protein
VSNGRVTLLHYSIIAKQRSTKEGIAVGANAAERSTIRIQRYPLDLRSWKS